MLTIVCAMLATLGRAADDPPRPADPRDIRWGETIPDEGYCDQPYIIATHDGAWLCVMTTGRGIEGERGQHVVALRSRDQGRSWSDPVDVEPAGGPEASWAMPLKVPGGRIYVFYTYNARDLRRVPGVEGPIGGRVDTIGDYVFKYSDDHGRTWSADRTTIPVREFRIDRENSTGGVERLFWGVGKPILAGGTAFLGFAKVGIWGDPGTMVTSRGAFLRSDNLATERDPAAIRWETLPAGDEGLRAPWGPVADEANLVALDDGSLFAAYRTIDGYPCQATSRDGGRSWTPPAYFERRPGGPRLKHPRAANFVRRLSGGRFLYWFHNHGGEAVHLAPWDPYRGRNPAWVVGGVERDGALHWSEPEILLYDDDPAVRISYPDFIEDGDRLYVTETQKTVARVHEVDRGLIDGLFRQLDPDAAFSVLREGLLAEHSGGPGTAFEFPGGPIAGGFTLEMRVRLDAFVPGQILIDAADESGRGLRVEASERSTLRLVLGDGTATTAWDTDPGTHAGTVGAGEWHDVTAIVEANPRLVLFVVDGVLNDGGAAREYGWGRLDPKLVHLGPARPATIAPKPIRGAVGRVRLYNRPLRVAEAVANHRAASVDQGKMPNVTRDGRSADR